jgi:polyether ionophore transport system permease protein
MTQISAPPVRLPENRPASTLTGARELTRFAFRRDRIMLPVWIYALTAIGASGGYGVRTIYKTPADRARLIHSIDHDAALNFLYGQLHGSSLGAIAAWRYLAYAALGAGLMSIFLVVRHTRGDEETGRLELIGSTAVGRHAPLAVALTTAAVANAVVFVLTSAVLAVTGLPLTGSIAFGLGEASCGLVFAALAAVAAQVSGTARGARGLAITALGVFFFLRAVGDSGGSHNLGWLTWLSPIGWAELVRPFGTGAERWWVLVFPVAATVTGIAVAFALAARRDQGAGLIPPRPGPAAAGPLLTGPLGLAWRLQRASLAGWTAGFLAGGLAIGVVANGVGQLIGSRNGAVGTTLTRIAQQHGLTSAYLASCMTLLATVASAYAVSVVLQMRSEETAGHAEPLLAGPVSRMWWGGSHLLIAAAGTAVVLMAGGLGMGLGYGLASSSLSTQLPSLLGASLVQIPAALAVAGVAAAVLGLVPRWSAGAGWGVVGLSVVIAIFGPAFNLSRAVLDISPFTHAPRLPGGTLTAAPLIWLSVAALAFAAVCLTGLRRRDIG